MQERDKFVLKSKYQPTGDQPKAIEDLCGSLKRGSKYSTLVGVTGSGKTFTMANVIAEMNRPALIISHNKTLSAQLYAEFKEFFPENAVEYFVSYYDYYQPEAYIPQTDTYIEKDSSINDEIEKLRISAASALVSRRDVIVVATVSCIYGLGSPEDFRKMMIPLRPGIAMKRGELVEKLTDIHYERNNTAFERGLFRVRGDVVDVFPAYLDSALRIEFFGDEIDCLKKIDPVTGSPLGKLDRFDLYPATGFVTPKDSISAAIPNIRAELDARVAELESQNKLVEAQRIKMRTEQDLDMLAETGFCTGIENYSRHLAGRPAGSRPWCLLDFFPKDTILFIDESHVTYPQIRGMYNGDRARKERLIEYGFRLPSALDNRPLRPAEFDSLTGQTIFVSATPAPFELSVSDTVAEQIIRPTGLLDPEMIIRPIAGQVEDCAAEIKAAAEKGERVFVTTLTKRMSEEISEFLRESGVRIEYLHSDIDAIERVEILRRLRSGDFDALVGVNLLREGLDIPEVSLVCILDADKEGFLRNHRSLTQTAGRAARNVNGKVIMYADKITDSMRRTIDETERRRSKQIKYNEEHGITPTQIIKTSSAKDLIELQGGEFKDSDKVKQKQQSKLAPKQTPRKKAEPKPYIPAFETGMSVAADPIVDYMTANDLRARMIKVESDMREAARRTDFLEAAALRDEMLNLRARLDKMKN